MGLRGRNETRGNLRNYECLGNGGNLGNHEFLEERTQGHDEGERGRGQELKRRR